MEFYWQECFRELAPVLLKGIGVVIEITVISFLLCMLLASVLAIFSIIGAKPVRGLISAFTELIRGTPLLVQVFYIYYVFPVLYAYIRSLFSGSLDYPQIPAIAAGICGLTICYACYITEVIRSAIFNIDAGQFDAAFSLGFSKRQTLFRIIFPQAVKNSIPVFGNYLLMMVKDTSILQAIAVPELLMRTREYASKSFYTIESYTLAALFYLMLSLPLSALVRYLNKRTKSSTENGNEKILFDWRKEHSGKKLKSK